MSDTLFDAGAKPAPAKIRKRMRRAMTEHQRALTVAQPKTFLQVVADLAADPSVDPAKMRELADYHREHVARPAFNRAFIEMKPNLPAIRKDGKIQLKTGGVIRFIPYERLNEVAEPVLLKCGFVIKHQSEFVGDQWIIRTIIEHIDGYCITSVWPVIQERPPGAAMNAQQAVGAGAAYAKRYNLMMLLNIQSEAAEHRDADATVPEKTITPAQAKKFNDRIDAVKNPAELRKLIKDNYHIDSVEELRASLAKKFDNSLATYEARE